MEAPTPREAQVAAARLAVVTTVRKRPEMVAVAATVQENKEFALMMPVAAEAWVAAAACTVAAAWDLIALPRGVADVERMGSAAAVMVPAAAVVDLVVAARGLEAAALVAKAATEAGLDSADGPGAMAEVERAAAARALVARALAVAAMPEVVAKVGASQVKEEVVVMARARAAAAGKGSAAAVRGVVAAAVAWAGTVRGLAAVARGMVAAATGAAVAVMAWAGAVRAAVLKVVVARAVVVREVEATVGVARVVAGMVAVEEVEEVEVTVRVGVVMAVAEALTVTAAATAVRMMDPTQSSTVCRAEEPIQEGRTRQTSRLARPGCSQT